MSEAEVKRQVDVLGGGKNKRQFKKPYVINIKRSVMVKRANGVGWSCGDSG